MAASKKSVKKDPKDLFPFEYGDRVIHKKDGLVEIVSGQYMGRYGVSNFWDWRKVLSNGSLSKKTYCGYGTYDEFDFTTIKRRKSEPKTEWVCIACEETECHYSVNAVLKHLYPDKCPLSDPGIQHWVKGVSDK
jgi:hypothetical protein